MRAVNKACAYTAGERLVSGLSLCVSYCIHSPEYDAVEPYSRADHDSVLISRARNAVEMHSSGNRDSPLMNAIFDTGF